MCSSLILTGKTAGIACKSSKVKSNRTTNGQLVVVDGRLLVFLLFALCSSNNKNIYFSISWNQCCSIFVSWMRAYVRWHEMKSVGENFKSQSWTSPRLLLPGTTFFYVGVGATIPEEEDDVKYLAGIMRRSLIGGRPDPGGSVGKWCCRCCTD